MNATPIDALSDSYQCYCGWGGPKQTYYTGNMSEDSQDNPNGNYQGKFAYKTGNPDGDGRISIYETVRKCWQLVENLEKVPDMTDSIDSIIQCAIDEPGFIWNVPNEDIGQWSGRLTKASARALRAKLWMHAASPLFNNSQPYITYSKKPTGLEDELHVWFGKEDPSLWQRCLQYCNDFFNDNAANGNYYELIQPESQNEAGYRKAFRRAYRYRNDATHHEKIFDAQPSVYLSDDVVNGSRVNHWGWGWEGFCLDGLRQGGAVPTNELMECFGMQDGRNFPYENIYGKGNDEGPGVGRHQA